MLSAILCAIGSTTEEASAILTHHTHGDLSPHDLKVLVEKSLDADKAMDITTIELDEQSAIADYMIIASGTSSRHVAAMAEKLKDRLTVRGMKGFRLEGTETADWVVMDIGDIVVHLFRPEVRAFYNIEKMWAMPHQFDVVGGHQTA